MCEVCYKSTSLVDVIIGWDPSTVMFFVVIAYIFVGDTISSPSSSRPHSASPEAFQARFRLMFFVVSRVQGT